MDKLRGIALGEKKGQVWVETVIYTLIGLAVIGILLAVSKPKIEEMKDKIVIEQTIKSLNDISARIYDVQIAPGNKRVLDLKISKGRFYIDSGQDKIGWIIESNYQYSQIGKVVNIGKLQIETTEAGLYLIEVSVEYSANILYDGNEEYVSFESSPTPYKLIIENKGAAGNNVAMVDLHV